MILETLTIEQLKLARKSQSIISENRQSFMTNFEQMEKNEKRTIDELPWIDLELMLSDYNWQASGFCVLVHKR